MQSRFWSFVQACEDAHTVRATRELLSHSLRSLGFGGFAILTHAPAHDVRSLGVFVHAWPEAAVDHLLGGLRDGRSNPLFEEVERTLETVHWMSGTWRRSLNSDELEWLDELRRLAKGDGATRALKTPLVSASVSLTSEDPLRQDLLKAGLSMANFAFHQIQFLQKPHLSEPDRLTARERECLYRAVVLGERPSVVARRLGVKVSTVRTLRQKANGRLDADSAEQAVWRMIETGQLFRRGRKGKPRSW